MLLDIKQYLTEKKTANLETLALHFQQPPDNIRCMLGHWIRKGKVSALTKPSACGRYCQFCKPELTEVYQWVGSMRIRPREEKIRSLTE